MSIDWSKAPEWATHHGYVGIGGQPVWLDDCQYTYVDGKQNGRVFSFVKKEGWEFDEIIGVSPRPAMPKWNGEGLPPVGAVCEHEGAIGGSRQEWVRAEILAHTVVNGQKVSVHQIGEQISFSSARHYRPIRTPEQIAAEEREKAIFSMQRLIEESDKHGTFDQLGVLYDAGYRLVEGGAQ